METAFYAIVAVNVIYFGWAAWLTRRNLSMVSEAMQLLASRSYGEYAAGKQRMATPPKPPETFDPGF